MKQQLVAGQLSALNFSIFQGNIDEYYCKKKNELKKVSLEISVLRLE
jgi:hypothetical protein